MNELDVHIDEWRRYVQRKAAISTADVEEMEGHLRDQVEDLVGSGLTEDEAFLVAVKRLGKLDDISSEFAREHSERLWKQLLPSAPAEASGDTRELWVVLGLAAAAAICLRALIGLDPSDGRLVRNGPLLVLPFLAGYFAWKRRASPGVIGAGAAVIAAGAVLVNTYPFEDADTTQILAAVHLPVVLWLVAGFAYVGGQWRSHRRRMDFIRFTGEWVVYYALLALGGGVLMGLTAGTLNALGTDPEPLFEWVLPMGAAGAVLVAAWLVEAKQAVIENIAPVLTRVFTPLTLLMLLGMLAALASGGDLGEVDRELLILMDLVLVLVVGLVLYALSARDPLQPATWFDTLQLVVVATALVVDAVLLVAMVTRIVDGGLTANKLAALGLNLVLLVNLVGALRLGLGFVRGRTGFASLERWQTGYLPVYGAWAAFVVVVLPPVFGFA